jgi:predicted negative regulator of RcsB-dependent stress response
MGKALAVLAIASAALFAALTVWTNHTTAAAHEHSHEFTQNAKTICAHAKHTRAGVASAAARLEALTDPPNVHRAVARLVLAWRSGAKRKQVRLAAHLLGVTACESVVPR